MIHAPFGPVVRRARKIVNGNSLRKKALKSGAWIAGAGSVEQGLRFLRNMILTRLLAPEAFGQMAIVLACYAAIEAFTEIGQAAAVIHNRRGHDPNFLNSVWWISLLRGALLFTAGFFLSPLVAGIYHSPPLTVLLRIIFCSLLFKSLISPVVHSRAKGLAFRDYVFVQSGGGIIGIGVAVALAVRYHSAIALVIGFVAEDAARMILSYIFCPHRPRLLFDRQCVREILAYTRGLVGMPVFTFIFLRADIFILAKFVSQDLLGYYSMATHLAAIPVAMVTQLFGQLFTPTFSLIQNDAEKIRTLLRHFTALIAGIAVPLGGAAAFFGAVILSTVYGSDYSRVAVPFALIVWAAVLRVCALPIASYYYAIGKPGLNRAFTIFRAVFLLVTIVPLAYLLGPTGTAMSVVAAMASGYLVQLRSLKKNLGVGFMEYCSLFKNGCIVSVWIPCLWIVSFFTAGTIKVPPIAWCAIGCGLSYAFIAWRLVARHWGEARKRLF